MKNEKNKTAKKASKKTAAAIAMVDSNIEGMKPEAQADALERLNNLMLESYGPNEKFPFGIKLNEDGVVRYERFKTQKVRDNRIAILGGGGATLETVTWAANGLYQQLPVTAEAPAPAPEPELGNAQGITLVSGVKEETVKTKKGKKTTAKQAAAKVKAAKVVDDALRVRLYAKGEFYFGKQVALRIGNLPNMLVEVKGKMVTLTPTKSTKDALTIGKCHANPVLRAAKVLAETGWSKETQDLVAKPVGEAGFKVEVR
jgi:hypothetical protein